MARTTLTINSDLENVPLVGVSVRAIAAMTFDLDTAAMIELCVVEAVNNVIKHAYSGEGGHCLTVEVTLRNDHITIVVTDSGRAMQDGILESRQDALDYDADDLDSIPEGGMGLAIIQSVMARVEYSRENGLNVLSMSLGANTPSDAAP